MNTGIYKITNLTNGKIYVGSAANFKTRWACHTHRLREKKHHSPHLQNAWNKHGAEAFEFSVIEFVEDKTKLIEREQYWIDNLNPEYNICKIAGSPLGRKLSDETKAKMSLSRQQITDETRAKISIASKNMVRTKEHYAKISAAQIGKIISKETRAKMSLAKQRITDETRAKMSASHKGIKRSPETRAKMSLAKRQMTDETKAKMSMRMKGNQNTLGYKHSEESRLKMSIAQRNKVPVSEETKSKLKAAWVVRKAKAKLLEELNGNA